MLLLGLELLSAATQRESFSFKLVFNRHGAIFFPPSEQHRDMKADGISYEDDYKGNALAAMLSPGRIEIRFHARFTDQEIARIIQLLVERPELQFMAAWPVTYQGRLLSDCNSTKHPL